MTRDAAFARRALIATGIIALAAGLLFLAVRLAGVLILLFAAVLVAILLDGLTMLLHRSSRLPRAWSLVVVCVVLAGLLTAFVAIGGPRIAEQLAELRERLPHALDQISERLSRIPGFRSVREELPTVGEAAIGAGGLARIGGAFSTALGALTAVGAVALMGLYLAIRPTSYYGPLLSLVPGDGRPRAAQILDVMAGALRRWLVARLVSMIVIGVLTGVGLQIAGVPLAFTLGTLAGLFSFVPFIGAIVSAVPGILVGLMESPTTALWAAAIYLGAQALESNIIEPVVEGRAIRVPPAAIVAGQLIVGLLFGLPGILIATPLLVVTIVLVQTLYLEDLLGRQVRVLGTPEPDS